MAGSLGNTENLSLDEVARVLDFFLYRMDMDTRRKLMAEMPVQYAKLFPSATPARIQQLVAERIEEVRRGLS